MRFLLLLLLRVLGRAVGGVQLLEELLGLLLLKFASFEVLLLALLETVESSLKAPKRLEANERTTDQNFGILELFSLSLDFLLQKVHFRCSESFTNSGQVKELEYFAKSSFKL